jgi:glyoxylase-like metal-dependent hydrolase (beta-lactamase superfamily II)
LLRRRYAVQEDAGPDYCRAVDVLRISPGLWRWTAYHEEWRQKVGCVYYESRDGVVLVDPLVPPEDPERFWEALDRDVANAGGVVHVLVTVYWHTRSARELIERYSARVWAFARGSRAIERRVGGVTDPFAEGDPLPGGIDAFRTARANEVVFWIPAERALIPGDVLLGDGAGGMRLCPRFWLPERKSRAELAASLRPLLELPVERVLLSHGEPVLEGGRDALAAALTEAD